MFFDDYPQDKLTSIWGEFAKTRQSYTPHERWEGVVDGSYRNSSFLELTLDDIIYGYMKQEYPDEIAVDDMSEFQTISFMIILAKKSIIDYHFDNTIPVHEFDTFFKTTRLTTLFERNRDYSENKELLKKYEEKLMEMYTDDSMTLFDMLNKPELSKMFDDLYESEDYGIEFIDVFSNLMVYDFIKNYYRLNNERDLSNIYELREEWQDTSEECECESTTYSKASNEDYACPSTNSCD